MSVRFYYNKTNWRLRSANLHRDWIGSVLKREGKAAYSIDIIFTDDDMMLSINREFLNHDFNTDVISFDYGNAELLRGEIYIGVSTVRSNSRVYGVRFGDEMRRVLVHGILHLCGYGDKEEEFRLLMREFENKYLDLFRDEFRI